MLKCLNARLVFIRATCLFVALSYIIFSCAAGANAQLTSGYGYGNIPLSQGQQQGYAQASSQALPDDWPQPLSVPGMEKVTGLVQGDNAYKDKDPAGTIQPAAKKSAGSTPMPPAQSNVKPQKASVNPQAKQAQASAPKAAARGAPAKGGRHR